MPTPTPIEDNATAPVRRIAIALILAVVALWCLYWFVHAWNYWEDDAYIHLEFARSVARGQGFAFNGTVVAGDTAPLWVLLLAGMHALIPNWLVAGKVLIVIGAAIGLSGAYAFARRLVASLAPSSPYAAIFPAAFLLLIVVNPYTCYWIFSGMEPITAAGVAFWAVLAATREPPSANAFLAGCLLAGIGPLLRPEMLFLAILLAWPLLGQWTRLPARKLGTLAAGFVLIATPFLAWSLYALHAFGHLLPNTNAAKRAGPNDSVVRHLLTIYSLAFPLIVCGLLAGVVYLLVRPSAAGRSLRRAAASAFSARSEARSLPLAGWILILWASIATVFYIANHTYVQTRYILVTAPGLTIVILLLAFLASRNLGRLLFAAAFLSGIAASVITVRPFIRNKGISCQASRDTALFIRNHIPPDAPVAVYAIGQIAFDSEHPIIDTGGITRPSAIPFMGDPSPDMVRWIRSQGAQYYITGNQPEPEASIVYTVNQPFVGWSLHPGLYETSKPVEVWKLAQTPR
jgi:hypothetical protein